MGVPPHVYLDRGPGNTGFATKYLLWLLDVHVIWKGPDPWILGRIDNVHNHVQQGLEWRYKIERPESLDQMNDLMAAWLHQRNCIDLHRAAGRTRHEMFLDAAPATLRRLPEDFDAEAAMLSRPVTRRIDGRGIIEFTPRGGEKGFFYVDRPEIWNSAQYVSINPFAPAELLVLEEFDAATLKCSARIEATRVEHNAFGQLAAGAQLLAEHPIGAKRPGWTGALKDARRDSTERVRAAGVDPYADLPDAPEFSEQQLARRLARADGVDTAGKERTFEPTVARFRARAALRSADVQLSAGDEAALAAWAQRSEIPASEIAAVIETAKNRPPVTEEKTA